MEATQRRASDLTREEDGLLPSKVMKLVEDHDGDTYRVAYVASPRSRLQAAEAHHRDTYEE